MAKVKNTLGMRYEDANDSEKKFFRAELTRIEQEQGVDLLKRFQQTWQYVTELALIPDGITSAARLHLGYETESTPETAKRTKLKMV